MKKYCNTCKQMIPFNQFYEAHRRICARNKIIEIIRSEIFEVQKERRVFETTCEIIGQPLYGRQKQFLITE